VSRDVSIFSPAFTGTGTHFAYPRNDGQAELSYVASYPPADAYPSLQLLVRCFFAIFIMFVFFVFCVA